MHCCECVYFSPIPATARRPELLHAHGFGECRSLMFRIGYFHNAPPADAMLVEGDEGWGFYVGPLFGCIHFSAKDA